LKEVCRDLKQIYIAVNEIEAPASTAIFFLAPEATLAVALIITFLCGVREDEIILHVRTLFLSRN